MIERIREISRLSMKGKGLVGFLMMVFMGISGTVFASSASAINYAIEYKENVATNMPESVFRGLSPNASVLLSNNSPLRAGFRFLGWCDQATTNTNGTDTCASGHQHQPGGTVTLDGTANANNIKLYAMWGPPPYMQDLTPSTIATLLPNVGSTATVKDKRDQQDYTIAKLTDNKYWMVENLNLAGGTALDADKTDVTTEYITNYSAGSSRLEKTDGKLVLPASATKNTSNNNLTDSSQFGTNNYSYVYNSGNKTNCGASGQNTPCYSYYSWDAATLGSGRSISTDNTDAPYSICPKGWKLPTIRTTSVTNWQTTSDFYQLAHQYGIDSTTSTWESDSDFYNQAGPGTTPNFLLAGDYDSSSFYAGGSFGYYWSSTSSSSSTGARILSFRSSYVSSAESNGRGCGFSVRCVFDDTPYMQDLTSSSIAELLPNVGDTAKVKDKRDNQRYTISKLADGKYWMTENLNLAGGTAIESTKSDVDASYISSFSTSNNLTKDTTNNTIVLPASSTSGFNTYNYSYVYNSGNKTSNCSSPGCYSYYSWDAATLGSGRSISTDNTDAPYSICPKGWKLPTSRNTSATNWQTTSDFYQLAHQYGLDSTAYTYESDDGFYTQAGPGTTPNFLLAGNYYGGSFYDGGSSSYYWSSTSSSSGTDARYLFFGSVYVNSADYDYRRYGFSVRCLFGD